VTVIVDLDGVTFSYGDTVAVSNVSLTVEEGDFLGLVGPNGSGKTTLLHLMLGLHEPDEGSIELFGRPVDEFDDGGRIGYVSQKATSGAARCRSPSASASPWAGSRAPAEGGSPRPTVPLSPTRSRRSASANSPTDSSRSCPAARNSEHTSRVPWRATQIYSRSTSRPSASTPSRATPSTPSSTS